VWITLLCLAGAILLTFYHRMLQERWQPKPAQAEPADSASKKNR
jgi:hypothetical protein